MSTWREQLPILKLQKYIVLEKKYKSSLKPLCECMGRRREERGGGCAYEAIDPVTQYLLYRPVYVFPFILNKLKYC